MPGLAVGIVGVGHGHSNLYIPALLSNRSGQVVAVCDPDPGKLARRAGELGGVAAYPGHAEMFDAHPGLDLVFVLGEHHAMAGAAIATARRGFPFVLEKPGGLTLAEVRGVRDAAAESGVAAAVPFVQRTGPLADLFAAAGRPRHVVLQFLAGLPQRYRDSGDEWLLDRDRAGGGVMLNLGVHFIDAFLHFCAGGEPAEVIGSDLRSLEEGLAVDDYFGALPRSASGTTGFVEASYTFPSATARYVSFEIRGDRGFASMDEQGNAVITSARGTPTRRLALDADSNHYYAPFVARVYETFPRGFAGLPTLEDLVNVRQITDSISPPVPRTGAGSPPAPSQEGKPS
jgi:predicted dehydrogenase